MRRLRRWKEREPPLVLSAWKPHESKPGLWFREALGRYHPDRAWATDETRAERDAQLKHAGYTLMPRAIRWTFPKLSGLKPGPTSGPESVWWVPERVARVTCLAMART